MYPFKTIEGDVQKVWKSKNKELEEATKYNSKKKLFSFLEGPPTANAPPGLHHIEVRTFKDIFCKYKQMQGFTVPRKGGWDCHGLPIEVQVEKELGLNSKKAILDYGVSKFINKCRDNVFKYIKDWEENTQKLDYQIDLKNPYRTMDNEYIESVWWSLKELYDKDLLYEGMKVTPYCPRCETPLSTHEVAQGYKDISELTVVVKLRLKDEASTYFLAWTTTPWTLPSNMALAVNPKIKYVKVEKEGEKFILAKDLVNKYFDNPKIKEEFSGEELVGKFYDPIFPYFVDKFKNRKAWTVIPANFVNIDEGTGIVHMAPAFGEDDFTACEQNEIPFVQPIDEKGMFTDEIKEFKGMTVRDSNQKIINWLDGNRSLFKKEKYTHSYPFCWRCDTALIYYSNLSWFVKVTAIRDNLIKNNQKISWFPKNIKDGRFGKWLDGARDWALSRKKFWGTPLPIWRSKDGDEICVGSIKELEKLSGKKIEDLHKPEIDEVVIKKNGKEYRRVADLIDCWYDSGSASFAQLHYPFENKEYFEKLYPYDFIAEALDQTRGWFYTLHVIGTALFNKPAYKSVVCAGLLVDEKGEKMSKSKGNILVPSEIFSAVGVDAARLQMCTTTVGDQKRFSVHLVNESVLPFLNILFNTYRFTESLVKLSAKKPKEMPIEDRWILSKTNTLIKEITEELEKHKYHHCLRKFISFVNDDFSRWYIKLIRDRTSTQDESLGYTMSCIFDNLLRLLAPFAPYITEYINSNLFKRDELVNFQSWPKENVKEIDLELEKVMTIAKEITSAVLSERETNNLGVRWPLKKATATLPKESMVNVKKLFHIIESQANIKELELEEGKELTVKLDTEITKELEQEGFCRELIRKIQGLRKKAGLSKIDEIALIVNSDYNLSKFKDTIVDKVGAVNLSFGAIDGTYETSSEEKIKDQIFKIAFNKL